MSSLTELKKNYREYLLERPKLKLIIEYVVSIIVTVISSFIFAYGFRAFIAPTGPNGETINSLVSGGASGFSQVLVVLMRIMGVTALPDKTWQSIFYFLVNVPIFFLAFTKVGKRFAVTTLINVLFVSIFIEILPYDMLSIFQIGEDIVARALFAGVSTGVSCALAFYIGSSSGGLDVISMYIAVKKSTSIGKYSFIGNTMIVITFSLLNALHCNQMGTATDFTMALYTLIYFFTSSNVIDIFNSRNRKIQLEIITEMDHLDKILVQQFPHSCTVVDAKGGFSGKEKKIIYMVLSSFELNKAVKVIRQLDPQCFITAMDSKQVYGKFYIKPIK